MKHAPDLVFENIEAERLGDIIVGSFSIPLTIACVSGFAVTHE